MRQRSGWLAAAWVATMAWAGTAAGADEPQRPATAPALLAADDSLYLGHPAIYWVTQAKAAQPAEPRSRVVAALTAALADETGAVRVAAVDALGSLGDDARPAAAALVGRLDDETWVRAAAMETLAGLKRAAVPHLVTAFEKGDDSLRVRVCLVLGAIGGEAADAVATLEKAQPQVAAALGEQIATTLKLIRPAAAGIPNPQSLVSAAVPSAEQPAAAPIPNPQSLISTSAAPAKTADWPQFHGPNRDNLCAETGLLKTWPEQGPKLLWKLTGLGKGYSSVAIAGGKLFTMGDRAPEGEKASQYVMAYDLASRELCWATRVGPTHSDGPRCTPTVDGQLLYVVGTDGDLLCIAAESGKVRWQKNFARDFDGRMMSVWKFSESPLVDGRRLICTPGSREATLVALDKLSGETLWKAAVPGIGDRGKDGAGYSSAVVAEIEGVRQYLQMLGRGVVAVEAETGRFLWGYNRVANGTANITTPLVRGNIVFCSTSYGTGSALLRIVRNGKEFRAEEVYFLDGKTFQNHHGGVVLVGDYVYGGHGQNAGAPICVELATGRVAWKAEAPTRGSAAVLYADGHVLFRYDRGLVVLAAATPEAFQVKAQFTPLTADGPAWPHPVIHDGKLYLRHNDLLACYELRP